jgi:hypothetical protein
MQTSPGLADQILADLPSLDTLDARLAVVLGVAFLVFLLPHWLAARALAPDPTAGRIFAAALLQLAALLACVALQGYAVSFFGSSGASFAAAVVFLVFSLVVAAIYDIGFFRGVAYNGIIAAFVVGTGWAADRMLYRESGGLMARIWGSSGTVAEGGKETRAPAATAEVAGKAAPAPPPKPAPTPSPAPTPHYATVQEAQAAAIARYPELGRPGSPFNQRFLERHAGLKANDAEVLKSPDWPMKVASEVAGDFGMK